MKLTRRQLCAGLAALPLAGALEGCAKKTATNEIEVAVFNGGFGIDFFKEKAREFEQKFPEKLTPPGATRPLSIRVWGTPRVWEELRPRFVKGNVPDITWPGWGMDYWKLVSEEQVQPFDKWLEEKAYGQDTTWKDTFDSKLLNRGRYNGHHYLIPINNNVYGWWYDENLFNKNGWAPPKSYPELLDVCAKIKKSGIAPITYQGKYPYYVMSGFLFPWAISIGGIDTYNDAQDLVPGAWKSPAFLQAAELIVELREKGYFADGALGKTHLQAQTDFANGKAALIPCGTWLSNENKQDFAAHPQFKLQFLPPPIIPGGKGDPTTLGSGTEDWVLPTRSAHPDMAVEYFKFLMSLESQREWVRDKKTLSPIKGAENTDIPPELATAARYFNRAKSVWSTQYQQWYPGLKDSTDDAMRRLLGGELSAQQFVDQLERGAEKIRSDRSIIKHKVSRD
ncbi:MAG: extracellular solute-binding protein [Armatimonadetes bacterium]|nr:extracellular solute-binding protein [Armatimonadota bacterium]